MIRRATAEDVDELVAMETALFDNAMGEKLLHSELVRGEAWVLGTPIIGYVLGCYEEGLYDLLRLGVHPAAQGQGVGRVLLSFVLSRYTRVMLTVEKTNAKALRLYTKSGFEVAGHLPPGLAWVMVKNPAK